MKILIFIPMYNCAPQIARVINRLIPHRDKFHTILLVDNQSQDSTVLKAREAIKENNIKSASILINNLNVSLGGSHKVAFQYALDNHFSHIVVLHGDDQADIGDIVSYLTEDQLLGTDSLLGARFHPESKLIGYSSFRILGNRLLNIVCSVVCKNKIMDMGSGLNLYSSRFMKDTRYTLFPNDLTFNIFLLFHTYFNHYQTRFFPLTWREEDQISNAKVFRQMFLILKLSIRALINNKLIYKNHSMKESKYDIYFQA